MPLTMLTHPIINGLLDLGGKQSPCRPPQHTPIRREGGG